MIGLAGLSIRRPRAALAASLVVAIVLGAIGLGVSHSLSPSIVVVPGTESSRAQSLANAQFGPTQLVPILLQGPAAQLNRQGPQLVRALVKRPHTRALSAWDAGAASEGLRPSATAGMIVVSVDRPEKDVVNTDQPQIEALVARDVRAPVHASVTGQPSIDRALKNEALSTTRRSELIALGILFLLLLVGLRAPLAAVTVTAIGAGVVLSAFGLMALVGRVIETDPIAVALASMTGLALSVGYALLILDRFHQEEAGDEDGAPPQRGSAARAAQYETRATDGAERPTGLERGAAGATQHETRAADGAERTPALTRSAARATRYAAEAVAGTGRAVLFAGTGLILALLLASAIAPTKILTSVGIGVLLCSALAVGAAVVVVPAALVLCDRRIAIGWIAPKELVRDWDRLVGAGAWVRRRAVLAGALATAALVALAVPVLSLQTGPPGVSELPPGNSARQSFEEVARVMGPGWPTPYNMIVVSQSGPITTAATLAKLDTLQEQIARDPAVASVAGPGALSSQTKPLGKLPKSLNESGKLLSGGKSDLGKLVAGLGQAGSGAKQLQSGLRSASTGAGRLHSGAGEAQAGSAKLHAGLATARTGSAKLSGGLDQALAGANALKTGASQALAGSVEISSGLSSVGVPAAAGVPATKKLAGLTASTSEALGGAQSQSQSAASELASATAALQGMTSGKADPKYDEALAALNRAAGAVGDVSSGLASATPGAKEAAGIASTAATQGAFLASALDELHTGASKLQAGLLKLQHGNAQLAAGVGKLSGGGGQLTNGLTQLRNGAGALEAGLGQLTSGAGQLESGLAGGVSPTGQLVNGLGVMQASVAKFRGQLPSPKDLEELHEQSPGLFNSGYFLLAAIAGAQPSASNAAGFAVNVTHGGSAGQIVVVSRYPATAAQTAALGERLERQATRFAVADHLQVAVGGPAGNLENYTSATNARLPWVIVALALAVALALGVALRAVALPIVAVAFNLLTAAATFGVMSLLFSGPNPPLGGPGYIDPMSIVGIFTIVFGVSLIYLVVLLQRTREELVAGATVDGALDVALRKTAAASTGSGVLMIAALIPFATTDLLTVRELGVGLATAVAIDVFVVRPVLLPAAVELLGQWSWWPTQTAEQGAPKPPRQHRKWHLPQFPGTWRHPRSRPTPHP
jgi:putative drug exporter of the RND superfamily